MTVFKKQNILKQSIKLFTQEPLEKIILKKKNIYCSKKI